MDRRESIFAVVALGAAAGSMGCLAQSQGRVWRIGFLTLTNSSARNVDAFRAKLRELGYSEGKNLIVEWRSADGNLDRLPGLAADLVQMKVDVICAPGSPAIRSAQKATSSIPIVMIGTGDPVGSGFVASLARPGGNISGLSTMNSESGPKLLELLLATRPKLSYVAVLATPTSSSYRAFVSRLQETAKKVGVKILVTDASSPQEIEVAFSAMARGGVGGAIIESSPALNTHQVQIAELSAKHRMPSIGSNIGFARSGGLMSYGEKSSLRYARAAVFVDKILKGAKPSELPVEQASTFELVVNLKAANALGLAIPQVILLTADEVIR